MFNVMDYGARPEDGFDNAPAIQKCIDAATGTANPAKSTRNAKGSVFMPAGKYQTKSPLKFYSIEGINFYGEGGSTRICPVGNMQCALDINGVAHSEFYNFIIQGNNGQNESLVNCIQYYWDRNTAYRSSTANVFSNIKITGTLCQVGFRVGKDGNGDQLDNTSYYDLYIVGGYGTNSPQNKDSYQVGFYLGTEIFGNILGHHAYNQVVSHWKTGTKIRATNYKQFGGACGYNELDFYAGTLGYFGVDALRSEESARFFESIPRTGADALYSLKDIVWSAGKIIPNGQFIIMNSNGNLNIENLQVTGNVLSPGKEKILCVPPYSASLNLTGVNQQNTIDGFLSGVNSNTKVTINGIYRMDLSGGRIDGISSLTTR